MELMAEAVVVVGQGGQLTTLKTAAMAATE
jgi:hypothetical protein